MKTTASYNEEEFIFYLKMSDEFQKATKPEKYSYNELASATNNFAKVEMMFIEVFERLKMLLTIRY